MITRPATLLVAALLSAPALWQAFVTGEMEVSTALLRFLVAVAVSAFMLGLLDNLATGYRRQAAARSAAARRVGATAATGPRPPDAS
jgi:hypothetical protein